MPDNPMKKDEDQGQRRESPGKSEPMTQPDKGSEGANKDRKASDDELQKKQGPGNLDRDSHNR